MKIQTLSKAFSLIIVICFNFAWADGYSYATLSMKDLDEMRDQVKNRILQAEDLENDDIDAARGKLKDALELILSRPNTDNMVSKLVPLVRSPLRNLGSYESTVGELSSEAIIRMKSKDQKVEHRATALIMLENIMSEMKPEIKNKEIVKGIFEKIRDANLKLDKKVKNELRLRGMLRKKKSPSRLAKDILGKPKKDDD